MALDKPKDFYVGAVIRFLKDDYLVEAGDEATVDFVIPDLEKVVLKDVNRIVYYEEEGTLWEFVSGHKDG